MKISEEEFSDDGDDGNDIPINEIKFDEKYFTALNPDYESVIRRSVYFKKIFRKLNVLNPFTKRGLNESYYNDNPGAKQMHNEFFMGLINDPNYCDFVDMYNY